MVYFLCRNIYVSNYLIVASTNLSRFKVHAGLFRLLMKGIFDPYLLWPFCKTLIFLLVTGISTRDFTVCCHQKLCHIFFDWQHLWWVQWLYEYQTKMIFDKILIIRNIIESRYKHRKLLSKDCFISTDTTSY